MRTQARAGSRGRGVDLPGTQLDPALVGSEVMQTLYLRNTDFFVSRLTYSLLASGCPYLFLFLCFLLVSGVRSRLYFVQYIHRGLSGITAHVVLRRALFKVGRVLWYMTDFF